MFIKKLLVWNAITFGSAFVGAVGCMAGLMYLADHCGGWLSEKDKNGDQYLFINVGEMRKDQTVRKASLN